MGLGKVEVRNQEAGLPRKERMVDIVLFAMVIASAVSLVVVSPRQAQQKTLRALKDSDGVVHHCPPAEERGLQDDGPARPNYPTV